MAPFQSSGFHTGTGSAPEIEQIDPLATPAWDRKVTLLEKHSVFHLSAWARVLVETYGHRPHYLSISVQGNEVALVPLMEVNSVLTGRRGVSLPFSDFAGPLWVDPTRSDTVYDVLRNFATDRKWKHLEIRDGNIPPADSKPYLTYDCHRLDLRPGIETVERGLNSSVRQAIRKGQRNKIQVTVERSSRAMGEFYELHSRTRKRHGLPPQPASFFQSITNHLISADLGEIVLAKINGSAIAGAVFLRSGGQVIYKFGASDVEHWPARPNHLVMWSAIHHYVEMGLKELHFGRTSQDDDGLLRFKRSWGCQLEKLAYYRHTPAMSSWNHAGHRPVESHPWIFGHLPVSINKLAGRLIYRHLD